MPIRNDKAALRHRRPIALSPGQVALLLVYAAFMLGVCLLACVVPTRRALGIQPTEALRDQS